MKGVALWMLITLCIASGLPKTDSDTQHVSIPGNISIGGLVTMSLPGKSGECSTLSYLLGIEVLESLLFSVDRINANNELLPNITLGVKAFDTCGSEKAALDRAIKDFVLGDAWNSRGKSCANYERPVIGVIGPVFSYEAEHVTVFLNIFEVPIMSYSATSPELSDKSKYEYFSRTTPSDILQIEAMVDLILHFGWKHLSILYSDESYGENGYKWLKKVAYEKGICIVNKSKKLSLIYDKSEYKKVVQSVLSDNNINVIVLFCLEMVLDPLVQEILQQSGKRKIQLVGPESLGNVINQKKNKAQSLAAKQVIFFHPPVSNLEEFNDYFFNLTPETNTRNPWFRKFFQETMNCTFEKTADREICHANQTLRSANYTNFLGEFSLMPLVINGVYAFAHALSRIQKKRCASGNSNSCLPLNEIPGKELLDTIRTNSFESPTGSNVKFTSTGDVIGTYEIYFIGEVSGASYENVKVGEWKEKRLHFFPSKWKENFVPIKSGCSQSCGINQIEHRIPDKPDCCWECEDCALESLAVNKTLCKRCPKGFLPDKTFQTCTKIKAKYFSLDGKSVSIYLAVIPIIMSILGIAVLSFVAFVFVKYRNTPLVKASGREHSCLLFLGLLSAFFFPFVAVIKPSPFVCFWEVILDSLSITVCYVAIVVKNNRIYRIFNPDHGLTTKPAFVRPKSQMVISLALISFQALLLLALMIRNFPRDQLSYPSSTEVHHACVLSPTECVLSHSYNVMLLIFCTYYAYKTKNIPQNYNEAKYIAFAMYGSCVTAIAFIVITAITSSALNAIDKSAVSCFRVTFMATILLVCFFIPKVHVIVWKSETNVKHGRVTESDSATIHKQNEMEEYRRYGNATNDIGTAEKDVKKTAATNTRSTQTD